MTDEGQGLYELVEAYAHLGPHRTGTLGDRLTLEWLTIECQRRGALVEQQPYTFNRYDVEWEVQLDDKVIDSFPLFYEAVGNVETCTPLVRGSVGIASEPFYGSYAPLLDHIIGHARRISAPAIVCATRHPEGRLVALNRYPYLGSGIPTLCLPGHLEEDLLAANEVQVRIEASLVESTAWNFLARWGHSSKEPPVILTTPLTGWFACAGERGTGVALTLELASLLAERWPVLLVGTTGHELMGLGLHQFLTGHTDLEARMVVHVGASVAACELDPENGGLVLDSQRQARFSAPDNMLGQIEQVLSRAFAVVPVPATIAHRTRSWRGEAESWAPLNLPMLSIAGAFRLFHTPDDIPELATTPEALATVYDAVSEAVLLLATN